MAEDGGDVALDEDGNVILNDAGDVTSDCLFCTWFPILPCSDPFPPAGDTVSCRDASKCLWVSAARVCELLQDAVDKGDLGADCIASTDTACGPLCTVDESVPGCDYEVLYHNLFLTLYDNATQACYILCLDRDCAVTYPTMGGGSSSLDNPPGPVADDDVVYVGISDCLNPICDGDSNGVPDPPKPNPDPPLNPDATDCCGNPVGMFYEAKFEGLGDCACQGGVFKVQGSTQNRTYRIPPPNAGDGCGTLFQSTVVGVTQYTGPACARPVVTYVPLVEVVSVMYGGGLWEAKIGTADPAQSVFSSGLFGTCEGGTAPNGNTCIGGSVTISKRLPLP